MGRYRESEGGLVVAFGAVGWDWVESGMGKGVRGWMEWE